MAESKTGTDPKECEQFQRFEAAKKAIFDALDAFVVELDRANPGPGAPVFLITATRTTVDADKTILSVTDLSSSVGVACIARDHFDSRFRDGGPDVEQQLDEQIARTEQAKQKLTDP